MTSYELISSDLAARLGLKRLTLGLLAGSLAVNALLAGALLFKKESVSTVLIPVGFNEVTHPATVSDSHVDQDYLMLVARDLLSLALNVTPANVDFNREMLLKHVAPESFGAIDEALKAKASQIKKLHATTLFEAQTMNVNAHTLSVEAHGVKRHFIGKTETQRQKTSITLRFNLVAGKLQLASLSETDEKATKPSASHSL